MLLSTAIAAFGSPLAAGSQLNTTGAAVGDFNNDGKADLVLGELGGNTVGVLLGNGDGSFGTQQNVNTGNDPTAVTTADVNGDGKLDIVSADFGNTTVSVLLGNGNGTFQARKSFSTIGKATGIVAADVNGDGKVDLAAVTTVTYGSTYGMNVLLGNGDGTFGAAQNNTAGLGAKRVTAADLNRDGKIDLIVTNGKNLNVGIFNGNGDGSFGTMQTFSSGGYAFTAAAGDMNGDGAPDLVVANYQGSGNVAVLLNSGTGTFGSPQVSAVGTYPKSVAVADVNGDGKLDAIVTNTQVSSVSVLLGNGDGTLQPQVTFGSGLNPQTVVAADVNNDGRKDLVTGNIGGSGNATVMLGDVPPAVLSINRLSPAGSSTTGNTVSFAVTFNESVTGVDPTDFSPATTGSVAASTPVVVSGSGASYTVTVNGITGGGTLALNLVDDGTINDAANNPLQPGGVPSFSSSQTFSAGNRAVRTTIADFNGDGIPDIVVANQKADNVGVMLGNGDGTFKPQTTFSSTSNPVYVTAADVNGDGKLDLLTTNLIAPPQSIGSVGVLLGNGNGTFAPVVTYGAGFYPSWVAVADVNGDGKADLVVANSFSTSTSVGVLLGNGNGTFGTQTTFASGQGPVSVAVADVNHDGRPDIVAANLANTVGVLLNNGGGAFSASTTYAVGARPRAVALVDLNNDGNLDIVTANDTGNSVSVLLGTGNGTFQAQQSFASGTRSYDVSVADVNGDGKPDLLVANYGSASVSVLLGNGNGTLAPRFSFAAGSTPTSARFADVNRDGRLDLVVSNYAILGTVGVLRGAANANVTGQAYTIIPTIDTINGTAGNDQITLTQDPDAVHIDWKIGTTTAVVAINDPNGLTINGNGGSDVITLVNTGGNPLPNILHLNGTFTISGLTGPTALAGTTIEIGQSTVYFGYVSGVSPVAVIQQALAAGYNGGGWNGTPSGSNGAITSAAAAPAPALAAYGIGYADWADQVIAGQPSNTVEIRYTVMGDTNLDRVVNSTDAITMTRNYLIAGKTAWDLGNFNYDGTIDYTDAQILQADYNAVATGSAVPASSSDTGSSTPPPATSTGTPTPVGANTGTSGPLVIGNGINTTNDGDILKKNKKKDDRHGRDRHGR